MAKLYLLDGQYYFEDCGETTLCKTQFSHGEEEVILPKNNSANRQFVRCKKVTEEGYEVPVRTAEARVLGSAPKKDPCEWAYKWLSEEKAAELKAIMDEARANMEASKPAKQTKAEKLAAKIAKMQAELDELTAE